MARGEARRVRGTGLAAAIAGVLMLALVAPPIAPAKAQTDPATGSDEREASQAELESLNRRIEQTRAKSRALEAEAQRLAGEINTLRQELITVAESAQQREALLSALEDQLARLEDDLAERRKALTLRHGQLSGTLAALARLSEDPPQAVFLYPGTPAEAVRGALLLKSAVPALEGRARLLRDDLEALAAVRADIDDKIAELNRTDEALAADRARLESLITRKRDLYQQTAAVSQRTQRDLREMVEDSQSLQDLVARLRAAEAEADRAAEAARAKPAPEAPGTAEAPEPDQPTARQLARATRPAGLRPFPEKGAITAPARGTILRRYGESTGFGFNAKGLYVATRADAQVVAPFDGKVIYAGPFRDLGRILIVEHDGGYHSVLAGFERIDAVAGQWVLAGEPVGVMPSARIAQAGPKITVQGDEGGAPGSAGDGGRPQLYVEVRRGGQPVNPLQWITAGSLKVHG
ncbi:peptidoglycan DD-metalloendopeptidase family protein [Marivibrio halodurans]|uniref:Peptidoglycan DD-metalloendopeptidase family protein n=1 Tax=Marivibrio halodurans TaxID=2039722 RepID=A0A8J7SQ38_9PROT|nr:peptidoglycan DD-metalloendopeptidase family protein [Marivibrio halodurans]MBP5859008.1 peptidoglycan DD-metalloendopeptidase family protein [Marivibrio halodurans]